MALKNEAVARSLDVKGQICPYPIIMTRKELAGLKAGEVLEVVTDNPPTAHETMPGLCRGKGYLYEREEVSPGVWRFFIKKTS